jgi:hypothetical protein
MGFYPVAVVDYTLVTPTKNADCRQPSTRGGIQSGHAACSILGQVASRVVHPSWGTVYFGWHQQQADQVLLCDLAARPPVRQGTLAFFSKKLNLTQQKYSTYNHELLAIYEAVKHFRHMPEVCRGPRWSPSSSFNVGGPHYTKK